MKRYKLIIKPAIKIEDRHKIMFFLRVLGYEVSGSGQHTDNSGCDISFEKEEE